MKLRIILSPIRSHFRRSVREPESPMTTMTVKLTRARISIFFASRTAPRTRIVSIAARVRPLDRPAGLQQARPNGEPDEVRIGSGA